jgi:hypothetical protein
LSTNRTPYLHDEYLSICKKQAGNQTIRIVLQKWMSNPKKELMGLQIPFTKKSRHTQQQQQYIASMNRVCCDIDHKVATKTGSPFFLPLREIMNA